MYLQPSQREIFRKAQLVLDGDFMAYICQNSAWAAYDTKKYVVNTNTFTTYPFTIKSPTTPVNATIYGNMVQNGTPTPSNPVDVVGVGELETTGEHAGQYKIPILSGQTTTPVYIGEVETTRNLKKVIITGEESFMRMNDEYTTTGISINGRNWQLALSTTGGFLNSNNGSKLWILNSAFPDYTTAESMQEYFAQQYASGNPVVVWYVLASPETGIVNEPLLKIGTYADSVTSSIPVTINSDSVDITTTLKPSAVAVPSLSWSAGDDYKRSSGAWD